MNKSKGTEIFGDSDTEHSYIFARFVQYYTYAMRNCAKKCAECRSRMMFSASNKIFNMLQIDAN